MMGILRDRPLAIGISIDIKVAFYSSGILQLPNIHINHGVVLIGSHPRYGYLIKNSWGTWGTSGLAWLSHR